MNVDGCWGYSPGMQGLMQGCISCLVQRPADMCSYCVFLAACWSVITQCTIHFDGESGRGKKSE